LARPNLRGIGRTARQDDLIDFAFLKTCIDAGVDPGAAASMRCAEHLYVDTSQDVARSPWGHQLKCVTTSTKLYSYGQDRAVMPMEIMRAYGWPARGVLAQTGVRRDELADLIGEGMALQPLSVVLVAILATLGQDIKGLYGDGSCALGGA
jgi:hypothetical protein